MEVKDLIEAATEDEQAVIAGIVKRLSERPTVLVTVKEGGGRRRYVVVEDEETIRQLVGKSEAEMAELTRGQAGLYPVGCRWLRGYGRVDEMYRSLSLGEVVKVEEIDRKKVWGQ